MTSQATAKGNGDRYFPCYLHPPRTVLLSLLPLEPSSPLTPVKDFSAILQGHRQPGAAEHRQHPSVWLRAAMPCLDAGKGSFNSLLLPSPQTCSEIHDGAQPQSLPWDGLSVAPRRGGTRSSDGCACWKSAASQWSDVVRVPGTA